MKLHFLRYFVFLAEELHFGRAASKLSITQPPLSSAIKSLEEELQVQLLIRDSKHVELTQAGRAFLEEARQILEQVARASDVARIVAKGAYSIDGGHSFHVDRGHSSMRWRTPSLVS